MTEVREDRASVRNRPGSKKDIAESGHRESVETKRGELS